MTDEPRRIVRAYKTELDPTPAQKRQFVQHCGACRYIFNWALGRQIAAYETGGKHLSQANLNRELTALKQQEETAWLYDISNASLQAAIINVCSAYQHFFRRVKAGEKPGFPRFKSKARGLGTFRNFGGVTITEHTVQVPRIGIVKLKEHGYLPCIAYGKPTETQRLLGTTVSERAGRWYVSAQVEETLPELCPHEGETIAVHLGVRQLVTTSDAEPVPNPHALDRLARKLKREQQALARKQKGSANRDKQRRRVAKVHARISNIREDHAHKTTSAITQRAGALVLEQFDVRGMLEGSPKGHALSRRIADAAMGELRRQLQYKAEWVDIPVVLMERAFASSRRCPQCGAVKPPDWYEDVYRCEVCGLSLDREQVAVLNLLHAAQNGSTIDE